MRVRWARVTLASWILVASAGLVGGTAWSLQTRSAAAASAPASGALSFGGFERTYRLYVPGTLDRSHPSALVLALHGGGGTGEAMEKLTRGGLNRLADRDGFVVVYPDGLERHWNDGRGVAAYRAHRENIDDVGFLTALIDHLARALPIDRTRIYATGISNGGLMSFRLAREAATVIAAIAPVAISMSEQIVRMRQPARAVPVLMMPGTLDPLVPYTGGEIGGALAPARFSLGRVISVADAVRYWVEHNQCAAPPTVTMEPDRDPLDGTRVRREVYGSCRDGAEVALYAVDGGGHTWPGGLQYLPERIVGRTSRDMDANEVIWGFFRKFALRPSP
ncbi:MAG: PHB depolymerase family esterase [Armatimonadota bacterium]|nr:PHB depolymerase family esterase [Armatimonadota bacterium]